MATHQPGIGNRIAPPRFLAFCAIAAVAVPVAIWLTDAARGTMIGFDIAALVFLITVAPLLRESDAAAMRAASRRNDANRAVLLAIIGLTSFAVLAAVASELAGRGAPDPATVALVVTTLVLSWAFGNAVYALHYAHLYYLAGDDGGDGGGLSFPDTDEPEYWDFAYFAFTLGMTFQTSDVAIASLAMRRVAIAHSLIAFVFNLGIIAFTINVLGGS